MIDAAVISKAALLAGFAGFVSVFAQVDFKGTITLGSILLGIVIAAAAGISTVRSKVSSIWREEAAGWREKAERLEEALAAERAGRATDEREQQDLRHQLKGELAALNAKLKVEEAKHDFGVLIEKMQELHTEAMTVMASKTVTAVTDISSAIGDLGRRIDTGQAEQRQLLVEIRNALTKGDTT